MTREHLFFIPFIFSLGFVVGALVTRERPREAANGRQVQGLRIKSWIISIG